MQAANDGNVVALKKMLKCANEKEWKLVIRASLSFNDGFMARFVIYHSACNPLRHKQFLIHLIKQYILKINSAGLLTDVMIDTLLPNITRQDEKTLRMLMQLAIKVRCSSDFLNKIDRLWYKSHFKMSFKRKLLQLIKLYKGIAINKFYCNQKYHIVSIAITRGIKRHLDHLIPWCNKHISKWIKTDDFLRIKLLRHVIDISSGEFNYVVKNTDDATLDGLRLGYRDLKFIDTKIKTKPLPIIDDEIVNRIIPKVIQKLEPLRDSLSTKHASEAKSVVTAVKCLINTLSCEVAKRDPTLAFVPIFVGSAAEGTRCFYCNEFDCILLFKNEALKAKLGTRQELLEKVRYRLELLITAIILTPNMHFCEDKRFVVSEFAVYDSNKLICKSRFPCLHLTWIGHMYPDMDISIDLVPSCYLDESCHLPLHNYLPVLSKNTMYLDEHLNIPHSNIVRPSAQEIPQCYASLPKGGLSNLNTSKLENHIILSVPECIRKGYIISKAVRIIQILQSIAPQLRDLGVAGDIEDIVRSYYLKTCVLFLTQEYKQEEKDKGDPFQWTIKIYQKLKDFLIEGNIPVFFEDFVKFECNHGLEESKALTYRCCRQRVAMMVITDRILTLLTLYCAQRKRKRVSRFTNALNGLLDNV